MTITVAGNKKEYEEELEPPIYRNQYINNELYLNFHIDQEKTD